MSQPNYLIKKLSVFDKEFPSILNSINDVIDNKIETNDQSEAKKREKTDETILDTLNLSDKILCSTCNFSFNDRQEQIEHYKGDLHLYNLRQKLKGKQIVSSDEFENLTEISSISGSDTEDEENYKSSESEDEKVTNKLSENKNRTKLFLKLNDLTIISIFRSVISSKRDFPDNNQDVLKKVKSINCNDKWCIILVAAGHFASAVFKGDQVVVHKTFHRYVVRAKRGGVQSQHDSSGKHAKSAGANIRRSQEAAFKEEIKTLIGTDWKSEIDQCKCVFIRVPQYNKSVLIATGPNTAPFDKTDTRIRTIPFMTFRPTFNEVKRAHNLLSRVEHYDKDYLEILTRYEKKIVESPKQEKSKPKQKHNKTKSSPNTSLNEQDFDFSVKILPEPKQKVTITEQDEFIQSLSGDSLKLFNDIYTSCVTNNVTKLKQLLNPEEEDKLKIEDHKLLIEKLLNKRLNKQNGFTLLHLTSQHGFIDCVWELLLNGADPTIPDLSRNKILPYFVSPNKTIRDVYRRFVFDFPNRYDYEKAKINDPLSLEKMNEKLEKEKEKKKLKKQAKKERDALVKEKLTQQEVEENERKLFLTLTDQEKRMLVVDRNFLNLMPNNHKDELDSLTQAKYSPQKIRVISRCWYCGVDMSAGVPFEYCDYKFCSTKCLKSHRQQQQEIKNFNLRPK